MQRYDFLLAARNSEARIGATLESLWAAIESSDIDPNAARILLIDNGSADNTRAIAQSYLDKMLLKIIDAPEAGKSRALNLAVKDHLKGDILFFTDDDVTFTDGWLDNFIAEINQQPDYSIFAGRITGKWEKQLDQDMLSWDIPLGSTYAVHDQVQSGSCEPGLVWGPNMAVRREVFEAGIYFNPLVGPQPGKIYPMGQDTEFATRAFKAGFKSYFVAEASVEHTIKAATANEDWIIKRAERLGYGIFTKTSAAEYPRQLPAFVPLSIEILINRVAWSLGYYLTYLMPRGKRRFWTRWKALYYRGLWRGFRRFVAADQARGE